MAVYNEILVGRYNRLLQKLLSMKGPAAMNTLAPEMMAVLSLFHGTENRYLEGWDRFGQAVFIGATVGNLGAIRIRNPLVSNVMIVLESVVVFPQTADTPVLQQGTTALDLAALAGASRRLDARSQRNSSTQISSASPAAQLTGFGQTGLAAGVAWQWVQNENQELPLLPGDAYQVSSNTVNTGLTTSFIWRERFLEESERA